MAAPIHPLNVGVALLPGALMEEGVVQGVFIITDLALVHQGEEGTKIPLEFTTIIDHCLEDRPLHRALVQLVVLPLERRVPRRQFRVLPFEHSQLVCQLPPLAFGLFL